MSFDQNRGRNGWQKPCEKWKTAVSEHQQCWASRMAWVDLKTNYGKMCLIEKSLRQARQTMII